MIIAAIVIGCIVGLAALTAVVLVIGVRREKQIQRARQELMFRNAVDFAHWDEEVEHGDWFAFLGSELKRESVSIVARHEVEK
jgi:hypothetical protein